MKRIAYTLALLFGLVFIGVQVDNDTWFLLNCGRYVESFGVPHVEPFTMHEGWHYVMQQWLFALGLWQIYNAFGVAGLVAFSWVAGAIILLLYARLVRQASGGNRAATFVIVFPVGCMIAQIFFRQRPQMASTAIFLVAILLLERYRTARPRWIFAAFFALSALLVNLHAAMWPMLLVFLLPYLAEALLGKKLATHLPHDSAWRVRELVLLAVLVIAGGFVGPNGLEGVTYTLYGYGDPAVKAYVAEMDALRIDAPFWMYRFSLLLIFFLTAIYARHAVPLRHLLLAGGTAFMALVSVRSLFLFLLFATFPVGYVLRDWQPKSPPWTKARRALCAMLLLADIGAAVIHLAPLYTAPPVRPQIAAAAARLQELSAAEGRDAEHARIYTDYSTGNYIEFCGWRCYLDARAEVFLAAMNHDRDVFHEFIAVRDGRVTCRYFLDRYAFDALLVNRADTLWAYLAEDPDYICVWDSCAEGVVTDDPDDDLRIYRKK